MNKYYMTNAQPKTKGDAARLIHNLNVDIVRDLKKSKIDYGWIWTNLSVMPFKYTARYIEDNNGIEPQKNEAVIPVAGFISYTKGDS